MMNRSQTLGVLLATAALAAPLTAEAATISVFAAASLTDSLKEIAAGYEARSGDRILFNFGASSLLARQIQEGAPADIFFSADDAKMDGLEKQGLILKETRRNRLSNALVIIVAAEGGAVIRNPKDLVTDKIKRLALAEPQTVPAGIYAKEFLQKQNLWPAVAAKVVPTDNVRAALAAVEAGNVDAGIVYKTDAALSKRIRVAYEIPRADSPEIRYPMAVVKETKQAEAARRFLEYLESDAAAKIFETFGFVVRQ